MLIVLLGLVAGCSKDPRPAEVVQTAPVPSRAPPPVRVSLPTDPQGYYEACKERVEGPSEAGECTSNADCVASGCSKELCVSRTVGEGLSSPCERAPCFQVLDTCTCQEAVCTWTLKAELPEPLRKLTESVNSAP